MRDIPEKKPWYSVGTSPPTGRPEGALHDVDEFPYWRRLAGSVALVLLGSSEMAAVMPWVPWRDDLQPTVAIKQFLSSVDDEVPVRLKCEECAVIEFAREVETMDDDSDQHGASDIQMLAGKSSRRYEVTLRMRDGSSRMFVGSRSAPWQPGERVMFIENASRSER